MLAYPGAKIALLDDEGLREVANEETDHDAITEAFLQDPAGMVRRLLADVEEAL